MNSIQMYTARSPSLAGGEFGDRWFQHDFGRSNEHPNLALAW